MKRSLKTRALSFLAATILGTTALPAIASADICEKINFSAQSTVYDQVTRNVPGNDTITAKDAACIVKHISDLSTQEKVGIYLGKRLENPNKLNTMLDAVNDVRIRNNIKNAVNNNNSAYNWQNHPNAGQHNQPQHNQAQPNQPQHNQAHSNNNVIVNLCGRLNYSKKSKDSTYVQVKNIVKDNKTVYSNDIACIFQKVSSSQQEKIGLYLASRIEDPQNANVFLKEVSNNKTKKQIEAEVNKYNRSRSANAYLMDNLCGRINFSPRHKDSPYVQVKNIVNDNTMLLSSDVACIIKRVNPSQQEKIGLYLASHLNDPQNANLILNEVSNNKTKSQIQTEINKYARPAYPNYNHPQPSYPQPNNQPQSNYPQPNNQPQPNYPHHNNQAQPNYPNHNNAAYPPSTGNNNYPNYQHQNTKYDPRSNVIENVASKIDYTYNSRVMDQVKLYVGDHTIYASEAAKILNKLSDSSALANVGVYLTERLVDPENIDLLLKATMFDSAKDKIISAALDFQESHKNDPRFTPHIVQNIYDKIDFTFGSKVLKQIKLYLAFNYLYASECAKIIQKTDYSYQGEVGAFLVERLVDHDNIDLLIKAAQFDSGKQKISDAAINYRSSHNTNNNAYSSPKIATNIASKIDYTYSSKIMDQVKLYLGNDKIYASDAAEILKKIYDSSTQGNVGEYLVDRLADPENINLLINAVTYQSVKDRIVKAGLKNR